MSLSEGTVSQAAPATRLLTRLEDLFVRVEVHLQNARTAAAEGDLGVVMRLARALAGEAFEILAVAVELRTRTTAQ